MNQPNFSRVARAYRWMEYFTFGPFLLVCRFTQLDDLGDPRHALILGDGDGRFLKRLLARYPALTADVIDLSSAMIELAKRRTARDTDRVNFHVADIRTCALPGSTSYDLVAAHFFLDCLSEAEVAALFKRMMPRLTTGAICVISEFAVPGREPLRSIGRLLIRSLYFAFRLLTGLATRSLPDYGSILQAAGFVCEQSTPSLGGMLHSERWRFRA